jgi:hypothetical protein
MKIYELKADPKLPHHYFVAVEMKPMNSNNAGKMFLKYRPFYLNHSQIEKFRDIALLTQDKLFQTSQVEALEMYGLRDVAKEFAMLKLSAKVNQCTMHHFSSEFEIDEEWFASFVDQANSSKISKEKLLNAKIHY